MSAVLDRASFSQEFLLNWQNSLQTSRSAEHVLWQRDQLQSFIDQGLPSRRQELWKYTDLTFLHQCHLVKPARDCIAIDIKPYQLEDSWRIVFVNGWFVPELSDLNELPSSLTVASSDQLSGQDASDYEQVQSNQQGHVSATMCLNAALAGSGAYIKLSGGANLDKIIHILHINTATDDAFMQFPRHVITLEDNAKATLVEQHVGLQQASYMTNSVTQIKLAQGSECSYYKLQQESLSSQHIATVLVDQCRDSSWHGYYAGLGAQLNRDDVIFNLQQPGAACSLTGFYAISKTQHFDMHSYANHCAVNTTSSQHYNGLLAGKSTGIFNGKIYVAPGAVKASAHMLNHNLLLDEGVTANTKPELEIFNDDVQCSHGATIGQVDAEAMFYLQSRGLSEQQARLMLAHAHLERVVAKFSSGQIRRAVRNALADLEEASHE